MDLIEDFLSEIKKSADIGWLAEEIEEIISEGISMNVSEVSQSVELFELVSSLEWSKSDNKKRQQYETSRALNENEQVNVILDAIGSIYIDVPAFRQSALGRLKSFSDNITAIEFVSLEKEEGNYIITHDSVINESEKYKEKYQEFLKELDSGINN